MDLKLNGKKALLTGASKGLGFGVAFSLVQEGAQVVINSRSEEHLIQARQRILESTGKTVEILAGDLSNTESATKLADEAADMLGGLDILVTNTGGPRPGKFESMTDEDWLGAFNLLLMSHVRLIRAALPYLRQSETPSVLTVTSMAVKQPLPDLILSNSIRAATAGLTKTLSQELGREGIRFNSILPGYTDTERIQTLVKASAAQNHTTEDQERAKLAAEVPFQRIARVEEFAAAAVFLVSPAASYLNGVMLTVDGGAVKGLL
jgi:3-oxoacyl-[acyl-carrier protein] reductase